MRCYDCTQHVLIGSLNVCTLVEFAWSRAHVAYASAWVAGHRGWATQTNAILLQNGFSHFFQCRHMFFTCHPYKWTSVPCVCPQQRTIPLQSWSVCRWDQCECLIKMPIINLIINIKFILCLYLWFTNCVSTLFCSGTPLQLEI